MIASSGLVYAAPPPPAISAQGWILHINLAGLIFSINPPHCPPDWVRLQGPSGDRSGARGEERGMSTLLTVGRSPS